MGWTCSYSPRLIDPEPYVDEAHVVSSIEASRLEWTSSYLVSGRDAQQNGQQHRHIIQRLVETRRRVEIDLVHLGEGLAEKTGSGRICRLART